jgi:leader peptidase (prepilin peptidase) / N-methyltransferase
MAATRSEAVVGLDLAPPRGETSVEDRLIRHPVPVGLGALALGAAAFVASPAGAGGAIAALMAAVVVVLAAIDLDHRIVPNRIVLPAAAIVLVARLAFFPDHALEFLLAAVGAATAFLIPNLIGRSLMGMGDVKLALLLGAGLGWGVVGAISVAFLGVFPVAVGMLIRGGLGARRQPLPFAPFLALGTLLILFLPYVAGVGGS